MSIWNDMARVNLKELLMTLGNRLVIERGFDPANANERAYSTRAISEFTEWINAAEDARELLAEMGMDWPMADPAEGQPDVGQCFHAKFQGQELMFEVNGCSGKYLKCSALWSSRGRKRGQLITMLIGEQHVRSDERERFREAVARMGGVVDGGDVAIPADGERIEAGKIGGDQGDAE
jgi:hypothetical protein